MEIRFLGTSGHGITSSRNLPSMIIDKSILVDCGEGCLRSIIDAKIPLSNIRAIFISHQHADHFLGLISIIWQIAFYSDEKMTCPMIYVPKGMESSIRKIFELTYSSFDNVGFNLTIKELDMVNASALNIKVNNNEYHIKWAATSHSPICYAYNFNNLVTISGDTGVNCQNIVDITKGCKLLCHEASFPDELSDIAKRVNHSTPSNAALIATQCQVERLILYHIPDIPKNDEIKFLLNAKKIFPNIEIASDRTQITI
jgi:ribonuclease Z